MFIEIIGSLRSETTEHWNTCFKYDTKTQFLLSRKKFCTRDTGGVALLFHGYREPGLEIESDENCTIMYIYLIQKAKMTNMCCVLYIDRYDVSLAA